MTQIRIKSLFLSKDFKDLSIKRVKRFKTGIQGLFRLKSLVHGYLIRNEIDFENEINSNRSFVESGVKFNNFKLSRNRSFTFVVFAIWSPSMILKTKSTERSGRVFPMVVVYINLLPHSEFGRDLVHCTLGS